MTWPVMTPHAAGGLARGYELWDGLADLQLVRAMLATVRMPELPSDTALVDGVSVGESVGDGAVLSVGAGLGESVGVGTSVAGAVGVACASSSLRASLVCRLGG